MKRLAISVSGQTRTYTDNYLKFHKGLEILLGEYEYDLFGHTWNNCPDSKLPQDKDKFTSIYSSSNLDIWNEFAKDDIFRCVPFRGAWNNDPQWQNYINGNDKDIINFLRDRAIGAWAQIWSFNQTLRDIDPEQYDGLVRYRWDIFPLHHNKEIMTVAKKYINDFLYKTDDFLYGSYIGRSNCISSGPQLINWQTMQDMFMVFDQDGMCKLKNAHTNWMHTLETILEVNNQTHGPSSHELWACYLEACKVITSACMPIVITQLDNGKKPTEIYKENKKWNI